MKYGSSSKSLCSEKYFFHDFLAYYACLDHSILIYFSKWNIQGFHKSRSLHFIAVNMNADKKLHRQHVLSLTLLLFLAPFPSHWVAFLSLNTRGGPLSYCQSTWYVLWISVQGLRFSKGKWRRNGWRSRGNVKGVRLGREEAGETVVKMKNKYF